MVTRLPSVLLCSHLLQPFFVPQTIFNCAYQKLTTYSDFRRYKDFRGPFNEQAKHSQPSCGYRRFSLCRPPATSPPTDSPLDLGLSLPPLWPNMRSLAEALLASHLPSLSRAITVCESTRSDTRAQAATLLQFCTENSPAVQRQEMFRIGVSGPPGAGKSSLIERLGLRAVESGERIAVLAIDPSSERSGGSILGDKTRMEMLTRSESAFVRPTPTRGNMGGLARTTADASLLCEAAGCSLLLVETVGGGQVDTQVADIVDLLLLVLPPAGGDELQGIKKGIVEVADIVAVNKADGALQDSAAVAVAEYSAALTLTYRRSKTWQTPVLACSAVTGVGVPELWQQIRAFQQVMGEAGEVQQRRRAQCRQLLWSNVKEGLLDEFQRDENLRRNFDDCLQRVGEGQLASRAAAFGIVDSLIHRQQMVKAACMP
eukprot:TRINITY_DN3579_c0_g1_i5.p1 TRINITY_DN3579_c0_g1~~TRINITY_DN3579_c0_g1_i5.p1  ORF type:complete len:430 (+),score=71.61 TRINITY_DN3579_c0_g1_i5:222-1511(+)